MDGAEKHLFATSDGKQRVDPPYFDCGRGTATGGFGHCVPGCQQLAPRAAWGSQPVKRLVEAPFATPTSVGVLCTGTPDNSGVSRKTHT